MSALETWTFLFILLGPLVLAWGLCATAAAADRQARDLDDFDQWEDQWPTT